MENKITNSTPQSDNKKAFGGCLFLIFLIIIIALSFSKTNTTTTETTHTQETVYNSSWDGSVLQVESYLKDNLKDRKSYESIEWGKVIKQENGNFMVWHKYRAKNSYGGYVIEKQLFVLSPNGTVIECVQME